MEKHLEKAIKKIRFGVDKDYVNQLMLRWYETSIAISLIDPEFSDEIYDLLEEYGEDNELPENWWKNVMDLDEIIMKL